MDYSQPMGEPRGPAMLVPVRVWFRGDHQWTLDFAARCQLRTADRLGLAGLRVEAARAVGGWLMVGHLGAVLGELEQGARYASLLLRDGWTARELGNQLQPHVGMHGVQIADAVGFCASAGAALLMAAQHAEDQLLSSAAAELPMARLSEMG